MENKDLQPVEASELPLTSRESQPPLVVDLPDGQKLVVGDLDPGTVIEVATWRGTGRPDSRTNRFMLGVSTTEAEGIPSKRSLPTAQSFDQKSEIEQSNHPQLTPVSSQSSTQLSQISTNQVSTGLIYANVNPNSRSNSDLNSSGKKKKTDLIKKLLFYFASIASISALIFILIGPLEVKFAHPVSGAGTALGSASSSIIAVKTQKSYLVGDSVVSDLSPNKPSPVVGIVAAVSDRAILLSTDSGYIQVRIDQVHGKAVAVLPFIGQIANLIGR